MLAGWPIGKWCMFTGFISGKEIVFCMNFGSAADGRPIVADVVAGSQAD